MAEFSFLSDSDDEKAVQEVLSQAMDHCVLQQVAAINCSGFTDSALPTHLESRFQKLKSFPAKTKTVPVSFNSSKSFSHSSSAPPPPQNTSQVPTSDSAAAAAADNNISDEKYLVFPGGSSRCYYKETPDDNKGSHVVNSPIKSEKLASESGGFTFSPSKKNPDGKTGGNAKSGSSGSFFSSPSDSSTESCSPPRRTGCLWRSLKSGGKRKGKQSRPRVSTGGDGGGLSWGWTRSNDDLLMDSASFSSKSQKKMLRKVMKEEEKIAREAEKIVKWAKQASARMEVSGIEDELSEDEAFK